MISMIFRGWHRVSYIEYPGKIATVLFVGGCNFRCPFCHNPELVVESESLPQIAVEDVLEYLGRRRNLLDALVITGGEPLLQRELPWFVRKVKEMGYLVKVDSNGSSFEAFTALREEVDLWGIDYKLPFAEYRKVGGAQWAYATEKVLRELLASPSRLEVRTTIFPPFHSLEVLLAMAEEIREAHSWWWQNFRSQKTLSPEAQAVPPYPQSLLTEWQRLINAELGKELVKLRPAQ